MFWRTLLSSGIWMGRHSSESCAGACRSTAVAYGLTHIAVLVHLDGQAFVEVMRWRSLQHGGHLCSDVHCCPRASGGADIRRSHALALAEAWRSFMV